MLKDDNILILDSVQLAEKRARRAAYMREYSRKLGSTPVRGVLIACARCGVQTEKQHFSHDWCAECVRPAQLERRRAKNAAKGTVSVGSQLTCKHCQAPFIKEHKRQFYCSPCMVLSEREALPFHRKRQSKYQSARNKRLRQTNPAFAIRERISAGIKNSLKDGKNGRSWEILVGYTIADLMRHLERQFLPGMTWDNRGEWHIDHITPLASFKFESPDDAEFRAAWALSNLRPLWGGDNIKKSAKRLYLL